MLKDETNVHTSIYPTFNFFKNVIVTINLFWSNCPPATSITISKGVWSAPSYTKLLKITLSISSTFLFTTHIYLYTNPPLSIY